MTGKIFKSIFLSCLAVFILTFALTFGFSYKYYIDRTGEMLSGEAEYVKQGLLTVGDEYLDGIEEFSARVTIVTADGTVIYDSLAEDGNLSAFENHKDREEIKEALESGEGAAVRYSDSLGTRSVYYAVRLDDGRVLRLATEHYTVLSALMSIFGPILVLFFFVLLFAFLIAKKLSGTIVRPINEIDLNKPESAEVYDELKPIILKLSSQNYRVSRQLDELKMRESEFVSITSNMSEGMMVINSRAEILTANGSARGLLHFSEEMPHSVLSIEGVVGLRDAVSSALGGKNGYAEIDRGEKHYSLIATPVIGDGSVEGAVIVIIDDTEKEHRERLRREFTSNVSHELKTPLTSISGFAELIRCGMADGDEARHFADNIYKEAKRLITLVGDIIRLTQLDGREMPYDGEIELKAVAEEVAERLSQVAEALGVEITVSGEHLSVPGNERAIEEIIYNLTDNALKYNKRGGRVEIRIFMDGSSPTLSVKDNGIGIPKDKQDRVFERFYRVDKSHSREIGGTGLGLSIVKHAALYHKAELSLESEEGVGTEIRVRFRGSEKEEQPQP